MDEPDPYRRKIKRDYRELKQAQRDFNKRLSVLKARRLEALQKGDKEQARLLKEQIETLGTSKREAQSARWETLREDRNAKHTEERRLEERKDKFGRRRRFS